MYKLLDLFCGAGGAGHGYALAGFDVTGVDIAPQPRYPFAFIQADALDFLTEHWREFDVIHASPPCQAHSALTQGNRRRKDPLPSSLLHADLIPATRVLLSSTGAPWVMENVQGSTLRRDLTLCGLSFGLKVFRHRYFEVSGFTVTQPTHPSHRGHRVAGWRHGVRYDGDMVAVYGDGGGKGSVHEWQQAMEIDWTVDKRELAEAIPPAYTKFVGEQLLSGRK